MEPLMQGLRSLPGRIATLPPRAKWLAAGVGLVAVLASLVVAFVAAPAQRYEYVFTKLSPEDAAEAATILRGAGLFAKVEAGGEALSVPASRVHEARLLLASRGLPRSSGVGFELFDKGDLGVSEFTQRVNLQRAVEGELARTIGSMSKVRSVRVHLTLPQRALFRGEDRKASAAVFVKLYPGQRLDDAEAAGVRHLVASAVPYLPAGSVTIVDAQGGVVGGDASGDAQQASAKLEAELERRIVSLLSAALGEGAVEARVTATMDATEEDVTTSEVDQARTALRTERTQTESRNVMTPIGGASMPAAPGVFPNQPTSPLEIGSAPKQEAFNTSDQTRNYDVTNTVTHRVRREPRVVRLSVAVLVDGLDGRPRGPEEIKRLAELAKRAVGFDDDRGDLFEISSVPFARSAVVSGGEHVADGNAEVFAPWNVAAAAGLAGLLALLVVARGRRTAHATVSDGPQGAMGSLAELHAEPGASSPFMLEGKHRAHEIVERAKLLAREDPTRAAHLVQAWMNEGGPTRPSERR